MSCIGQSLLYQVALKLSDPDLLMIQHSGKSVVVLDVAGYVVTLVVRRLRLTAAEEWSTVICPEHTEANQKILRRDRDFADPAFFLDSKIHAELGRQLQSAAISKSIQRSIASIPEELTENVAWQHSARYCELLGLCDIKFSMIQRRVRGLLVCVKVLGLSIALHLTERRSRVLFEPRCELESVVFKTSDQKESAYSVAMLLQNQLPILLSPWEEAFCEQLPSQCDNARQRILLSMGTQLAEQLKAKTTPRSGDTADHTEVWNVFADQASRYNRILGFTPAELGHIARHELFITYVPRIGVEIRLIARRVPATETTYALAVLCLKMTSVPDQTEFVLHGDIAVRTGVFPSLREETHVKLCAFLVDEREQIRDYMLQHFRRDECQFQTELYLAMLSLREEDLSMLTCLHELYSLQVPLPQSNLTVTLRAFVQNKKWYWLPSCAEKPEIVIVKPSQDFHAVLRSPWHEELCTELARLATTVTRQVSEWRQFATDHWKRACVHAKQIRRLTGAQVTGPLVVYAAGHRVVIHQRQLDGINYHTASRYDASLECLVERESSELCRRLALDPPICVLSESLHEAVLRAIPVMTLPWSMHRAHCFPQAVQDAVMVLLLGSSWDPVTQQPRRPECALAMLPHDVLLEKIITPMASEWRHEMLQKETEVAARWAPQITTRR